MGHASFCNLLYPVALEGQLNCFQLFYTHAAVSQCSYKLVWHLLQSLFVYIRLMQALYTFQFFYTGCFWLIKFFLTWGDRKLEVYRPTYTFFKAIVIAKRTPYSWPNCKVHATFILLLLYSWYSMSKILSQDC